MTPERKVVDQEVRDRVTTDLGTTFLLEAGAGTGKTRVLVDRYVRCVLDPERGSGDVRTVAAITFTEKAAGELRQRVREEFEARAAGAAADSAEAEAIVRALDALDDAPISTIHGFAGRLLREFPVEARVDPAFEQLDGLGSELERARLWEEWLAALAGADIEAVAGVEADSGVEVVDSAGALDRVDAAGGVASAGRAARRLSRLLRSGVRLDKVHELAIGARGVFGERYDLDPAPAPAPADEPELGAALAALAEPLARLRAYCAAACVDQSDKGFAAAMDLVEAVARLIAAPPADVDLLAARLYALPAKDNKTAPGGAMKGWDAALGGKEELQLRYKALVAGIFSARDLYAEFVTGLAVWVADSFSRWAGAAQLALGRLDFTDLLGCLRDLLVRDCAARRALQA